MLGRVANFLISYHRRMCFNLSDQIFDYLFFFPINQTQKETQQSTIEMPFSVTSLKLDFIDGICCASREERERAEKREKLQKFLAQYDNLPEVQSVASSQNSFNKSTR